MHNPNPFIYLKGVKSSELEYIVDFLYFGEASLEQDELNNFLETAQELEIKGLQSDNTTQNKPDSQTMLCHEPEVERKFDESDDIIATSEVALVEIEDVKENSYELDQQIEQMIEISEDIWQCKECTKTSRLKMNISAATEQGTTTVPHYYK